MTNDELIEELQKLEAARQYFIYHLSQQRDRASRELAKLDARIQALRDN